MAGIILVSEERVLDISVIIIYIIDTRCKEQRVRLHADQWAFTIEVSNLWVVIVYRRPWRSYILRWPYDF